MEKVKSIEQIRELIAKVREKKFGFITNFYLDDFKHKIWINNNVFFFKWINNTLFFMKKNRTFYNVFYASTDLENFSKDISIFQMQHKEGGIVFDIVGRNEQCLSLVKMFQEQGFHETCLLVRMSRLTETTNYLLDDNDNVLSATENDVKNVYNLLRQYFEEETEQIPFFEEIEEYAKQGHILVCREGDQLAGFLIYEINASTLYLRYWFTHPKFRDKKIGSRLLHRFFEEGKNTKRQLLWVIQSNENAVKRYHHYGFKEENMFDHVMINN